MFSLLSFDYPQLEQGAWRIYQDDQGIAWLEINCPDQSMNVLGRQVMQDFNYCLDFLEKNPPKGLVILSGKANSFIAGANINEFAEHQSLQGMQEFIRLGWDIFNRLHNLRFPTLCLVHGVCFGGGFEMALACRYRIAIDEPDAVFSLPEVMLGIYPAWGGVKRLPALIGPASAFDLMLTGRQIKSRQAKKLGIVDYVVAPRVAQQTAAMLVLSNQKPRKATGLKAWLGKPPLRYVLLNKVRKSIHQKDPYGFYPAPLTMVELWEKYDGNGLKAPHLLKQLADTARNLQRVFHLQGRLKGFGKQGAGTQKIQHVHVIGAGVMGGGIATWCASRGIKTTLQDTDYSRIAKAFEQAKSTVLKRKPPREAQAILDRLIPDPLGEGVKTADVVIEAIFEDVHAKQALYATLEPQMKAQALLASNTSSLSLQVLSQGLQRPDRFVGIHFFNPVSKMPLVEVVHTEHSSQATLNQAYAFATQIGKLPLPVQDSPGFLVNAVLAPYMLQAMKCVDEGFSIEEIDQTVLKFGMPMGPLELADTVGLDIALAVGQQLCADQAIPSCLQTRIHQGQLGRKTGQGFYSWKAGKVVKTTKATANEQLSQRLTQPLFDYAQRCLDQGVVSDADLVDAGMVFGAGFAPFKGGPLHDRLG